MENKIKFSSEAEKIAYEQGLSRGISKGRRQAVSEYQLNIQSEIEKTKQQMSENNSVYKKAYDEGFVAGQNDIREQLKMILNIY